MRNCFTYPILLANCYSCRTYLLRCIITLGNCKCFMIKGDVNSRPFWANEGASDPSTSISNRNQEHKGSKNKIQQHALHSSFHRHDCCIVFLCLQSPNHLHPRIPTIVTHTLHTLGHIYFGSNLHWNNLFQGKSQLNYPVPILSYADSFIYFHILFTIENALWLALISTLIHWVSDLTEQSILT